MSWHPDMPDEFKNTITCGDSKVLSPQVPNESVDIILLDPPYNVGKDYGKKVDDSKKEADYIEWYRWICSESYRVMCDGYLYVSCKTDHIWTLRPLWEEYGFEFRQLLIWHGANFASNSNIQRQEWNYLYEPILFFRKGEPPKMLQNTGLKADSVLDYVRPQSDYSGDQRRQHVAQKPLLLYYNILGRTPGQVVLDWFMGSGTTAMAAKRLNRDFVGFEIEPGNIEIAYERLAKIQAEYQIEDNCKQISMFAED